jgi:hypothetical protein
MYTGEQSMKYLVWVFAAAVVLLFIQANSVFAGEFYEYTDKDGNLIFTDDFDKVPKEKQAEIKTYQSVKSAPQSSVSEQTKASVPAESNIPTTATENVRAPEENSGEESAPEDLVDNEESEEPNEVDNPSLEETPVTGEEIEDKTYAEEPTEGDLSAEESTLSEDVTETPEPSDDEVMTGYFDREKKELDLQLERLQQEKEKVEKLDVSQMTSRELNAHEERVKELNARIEGNRKEQARFQDRVNKFNERITSSKQKPQVGEGLR